MEDDASLDSTVRRSRTGYDLDVGATEEIGFEIYRFPSHLVRKGIVGVEKVDLSGSNDSRRCGPYSLPPFGGNQ